MNTCYKYNMKIVDDANKHVLMLDNDNNLSWA